MEYKIIVKLAEEKYIGWSTVCDSPSSYIQTRQEMLNDGVSADRLERADKYGSSALPEGSRSLEDYVKWNRASKKEETLSLELILKYFVDKQTYQERP